MLFVITTCNKTNPKFKVCDNDVIAGNMTSSIGLCKPKIIGGDVQTKYNMPICYSNTSKNKTVYIIYYGAIILKFN